MRIFSINGTKLAEANAITREAWNTSEQTQDKRERIQALSLAKECYSMKLDLLTNATVVDDAIRFVTEIHKSNTEPAINSHVVIEEEKLKNKTIILQQSNKMALLP